MISGAARAAPRRSAYSPASSRRYFSASSAVPLNAIDRCSVRPVTGSVPAATRISHTPGRRCRSDPVPFGATIDTNVGTDVGTFEPSLHPGVGQKPPLTWGNVWCARRDSNPQPSDP